MRHLTRAFAIVALSVGSAGAAHAQATPQLTPNVMLLIDTSGSMERVPSCVCSSESCTECLPSCSNVSSGRNDMNRWSMLLSAMTGTYPTFTCRADARPTSTAEPDFGYYIPHYSITSTVQNGNGILDSYANRVKFGLMTFDNIATLTTQSTLVTDSGWGGSVGAGSTGPYGDFSYGSDAVFELPGCATPFRMNNGARNYDATGRGRLLSPGTDATDTISAANAIQTELLSLRPYGATPTAGMLEDLEFFYDNDASVNLTGDRYRNCRKQYVVLITDGYPNADMRGTPYFCENTDGVCPYDEPEVTATRLCQPQGGKCTGFIDGLFVIGFNVGNDAAARARLNQIAIAGGTNAAPFTADTNDTDAAFFADDLPSLIRALETAINQAAPDATTRAAPAVSSTASQAEVVTATTSTVSSNVLQSQFNAGYRIPASGPWTGVLERRRTTCSGLTPSQQAIEDTDRFQVMLDARSTSTAQDVYNASLTAPRTLFTVVPTNAANVSGYLVGDGVASGLAPMGQATTVSTHGNGNPNNGGSNCTAGGHGGHGRPNNNTAIGPVQTGLAMVPFTWAGIGSNRQLFGSGVTAAEAQGIVDWVRGSRGGLSKLGDIYHSTPVVVSRPTFNLADESFNEFRRRDDVANRPTMLYVGSNDGVLHAFVAEDTTVTVNGSQRTYRAGHELWGFVPPYVYPLLKSATTSHQYTVDGSPYVREVFFRRRPNQSPDGSIYHTILIVPSGLGGSQSTGGTSPAYIALDVTNPFEPKFMWQFTTGSEMGALLGAPAIGQVLVNTSTGLEERAIAMLPAGAVAALDSATCGPVAQGDQWSQPLGCPSNGRGTPPLNQGTQNAVSHHRCWDSVGRHVYFIDPATGQAVAHLGSEVFNAPMTGGVGFYSGDTGTIATRAFMTDADGTMWRFDFTATNPQNWDATPFADMMATLRTEIPVGSQPAYGAPIITTDVEGNVVVIQATGNSEDFNSTAPNIVASYTETMIPDASGVPRLGLTTNWVQQLGVFRRTSTSGNYGEQVTGPIQLFNGVVYFASYRPPVATTSTCNNGTSYIWGLDYRAHTGTNTPVPRLPMGTSPETFGSNIAFPGQVVMGISIAQQISCSSFGAIDTSVYDPFLGTRGASSLGGSGGGAFQLLALSNGGTTTTGSSLSEITRTLPPPASYSRIAGVAGRAE